MKKQGIAFYLNGIAFVLGIAGVALTVYSSVVTADNALQHLSMLVAGGVAGLVLVLLAMILPNMKGNYEIASAASVLGAIALYSYVFGQCILQRVLLVSGLFSFNSGNTAGWQVFYITIGAVACLFVGALFLVIGSFCKSVKTVEA